MHRAAPTSRVQQHLQQLEHLKLDSLHMLLSTGIPKDPAVWVAQQWAHVRVDWPFHCPAPCTCKHRSWHGICCQQQWQAQRQQWTAPSSTTSAANCGLQAAPKGDPGHCGCANTASTHILTRPEAGKLVLHSQAGSQQGCLSNCRCIGATLRNVLWKGCTSAMGHECRPKSRGISAGWARSNVLS